MSTRPGLLWDNSRVHSLGSGQAVRLLTLDQVIGGSNPPSPAETRIAIDRSGYWRRNRDADLTLARGSETVTASSPVRVVTGRTDARGARNRDADFHAPLLDRRRPDRFRVRANDARAERDTHRRTAIHDGRCANAARSEPEPVIGLVTSAPVSGCERDTRTSSEQRF